MNFLKKAFGWIWKIISNPDTARLILDVAKQATAVVEVIAKLTPTRSDDELIALWRLYGLANIEKWLAFPIAERGAALLEAARAALLMENNDLERISQSTLNAGIELAVVEYKERAA